MKKALALLAAAALTAAIFTGCSGGSGKKAVSSKPESVASSNPFTQNDSNVTGPVDSIGHDLAHPRFGSDNKRLALHYTGGEMKIDYMVNASGKGKNIGFLVYIDGEAQPYKYNSASAPYEYMHIISLKENDKNYYFSFIFTPVIGRKGQTLNVAVTSIYNPGFMPDMKKTTSYGGYQDAFENDFKLTLDKTPLPFKQSVMPTNNCLRYVSQSATPVTNNMLSALMGGGAYLEKITMKSLDTKVYQLVLFGQKETSLLSNYKIKKSGTLHVNFQLFGHPGMRYKTTFYLNHQALSDGKNISFATDLKKGYASVITLDIALNRLKNRSTFYAVSAPCNADDYPNDVVDLIKTNSILLYKQEGKQ